MHLKRTSPYPSRLRASCAPVMCLPDRKGDAPVTQMLGVICQPGFSRPELWLFRRERQLDTVLSLSPRLTMETHANPASTMRGVMGGWRAVTSAGPFL